MVFFLDVFLSPVRHEYDVEHGHFLNTAGENFLSPRLVIYEG